MSVQIQEILNKFPDLLTLKRGASNTMVARPQAACLANEDSLVFAGSAQHLKEALESKSKTWIVSPELEADVPQFIPNLLISSATQLAMALIAREFFPLKENVSLVNSEAIHPSAVISESAKIGERCIIGPGVVIGNNTQIGNDCIIGANTVVGPNVKIGERTHLHPLVFIAHDCEIGKNCVILPNTTIGSQGFGYAQDKSFNHYHITHYGRVVIEDDVHIGAGVQIDRGTYLDSRIGYGTKIDNHCHFGHNFQVGRNTLITGGVLGAGSLTIGSNCVLGGRTTIKGHLSICDQVQIGGASVVTQSITEPGQYSGFPLQSVNQDLRVRSTLKNLPEMAKQIRRILKHLGLESK